MSNSQVSEPQRVKRPKRNISGVLLLDKPSGISSNQALQIARRIFTAAKAGHTGTLDPMATGLLPICFGEATKFSSALLGADKTYEATLKLGFVSSTGDAEGEISAAGDGASFTLQQVETALKDFIGSITQIPPMYSALKHQGKPLYAYAREGVEIERQPRQVTIYNLCLQALAGDEMRIAVKCSTGTYVRTLAEDIGKALGCGGAYLTALRRSSIHDFDLSQAVTLDALEAMSLPQRDACLRPVDSLLHDFPAVTLDAAAAGLLLQGQAVTDFSHEIAEPGGIGGKVRPCSAGALACKITEPGGIDGKVRLYRADGQFLGLGEVTAGGGIAPKRLLVPP